MLVVITCSSALGFPLRAPEVVGVSRTTTRLQETSLVKLSTFLHPFRGDSSVGNRRTPALPPSLRDAPTQKVVSCVPPCFPRLCQAIGFTASPSVAGEGKGRSSEGWPTSRPFSAVESVSSPTRFRAAMTCSSMGFVPLRGLSDGGADTHSQLQSFRFRGGFCAPQCLRCHGALRCADPLRSDPGEVHTFIRLIA